MKIFTTEQIENRNKIIELIETGEALNLELAEQLCAGQCFDFENIISEVCGELLELANLQLNIEGILSLKQLELLSLSGKNLETLPKGLGLLTNIEILSISNNQISDISEISTLTTLRVLYCNDNQISNLADSICELVNLEKLHIGHNRLVSLPEELGNLPELCELHCNDNHLTRLPDSICRVRVINFKNNF